MKLRSAAETAGFILQKVME